MALTEIETAEEGVINEGKFVRVAGELLAALADGRIDREERDRILDGLADMVRVDNLLDRGVDFIVDLLHRDQDELRAAAERKRERAAELREKIEDLRARLDDDAEGKSRRLRRLLNKVDDLEDDADDLDERAEALDAAADEDEDGEE